jgi:hypothetical protein
MQKKPKKIFRKKDKLRVRKSYYTFTREYPKYIEVEKTGRRITVSTLKTAAVRLAIFLLIASVSFFCVKLAINISYAPITEETETVQESSFNEKIISQGVKALYMPQEKMGDEEYVEDFIKKLKKKNCNSVVIDFKTAEGRLSYTSMNETAIAASAAVYDNDTARWVIDAFKDEGIAVIARIYCFSDSRAAAADSDIAVKYMSTDVNWRDGSDENGGISWLNPYSKTTKAYISEVAKEVSKLGVGIFILEDLQFPGGENTASATYPGEKDKANRNTALKNALAQVKRALPENAIVILSQSATDALAGNEGVYYGTMGNADYYGLAVDTADRPVSIAIDKKADFVSVLSMYSSIAGRFANKTIIPIVPTDEYSYSYFRAMKKSGITSYILYNENGEY